MMPPMPMPSHRDAAGRDVRFDAACRDVRTDAACRDVRFDAARRGVRFDAARRGDDGFTLLEVLVAFAIAALALGVLFEGAVGGLRSTRVADRTEEALSRAQSHLAAVGQGMPLGSGTQEGDDGGGYHWSVRIRPLRSAVSTSARIVLYAVQVTESWDAAGGGDATRSVVLRTERLGVAHGDAS